MPFFAGIDVNALSTQHKHTHTHKPHTFMLQIFHFPILLICVCVLFFVLCCLVCDVLTRLCVDPIIIWLTSQNPNVLRCFLKVHHFPKKCHYYSLFFLNDTIS